MSRYSNTLFIERVAITALAVVALCLPQTLLGQGTFVIPPGFKSKEGDSSWHLNGPLHFQLLAEPGAFSGSAPGGGVADCDELPTKHAAS